MHFVQRKHTSISGKKHCNPLNIAIYEKTHYFGSPDKQNNIFIMLKFL
jgi:hypothetical protein